MMKAVIGATALLLSFSAATSDAIEGFTHNLSNHEDHSIEHVSLYDQANMPKLGEISSPYEKINYIAKHADLDDHYLYNLKETNPKVFCTAVNTYWEARGEPLAGKAAVAEVVYNRSKSSAYPDSPCGVVKQTSVIKSRKVCQFSWVCQRGGVVTPVTSRSSEKQKKEWRDSVVVAVAVLSGKVKGFVGKSTHFYNHHQVTPPWARGKAKYVISNHTFVEIK